MDTKINNISYIQLFNFVKEIDYDYKEDAKIFTIELPNEQFEILADLLNKCVGRILNLESIVNKDTVKITNFNLVLDACDLDCIEFYRELNFENS